MSAEQSAGLIPESNLRAISVFASYTALCVSLTTFILRDLWRRSKTLSQANPPWKPPRAPVLLFSILAFASLASTWYHMFRYLQHSYQAWVYWQSFYKGSLPDLSLGRWMSETQLFKETWATVMVGASRYWWSSQIFLFACHFGLDLEQKGIRRGIRHTWAFMLLGQIVAVSFAANLFFLTRLLNPPTLTKTKPSSGRVIGPWLINFAAVWGTLLSVFLLQSDKFLKAPWFVPCLLTPHVLLLLLPTLRTAVPSKYLSEEGIGFTEEVNSYLKNTVIGGGFIIFFRATGKVIEQDGLGNISKAFSDNPAVTSVGYDVIFCWLTWTAWWWTEKLSLADFDEYKGSMDKKGK